mgnify:CR=1 FL=1
MVSALYYIVLIVVSISAGVAALLSSATCSHVLDEFPAPLRITIAVACGFVCGVVFSFGFFGLYLGRVMHEDVQLAAVVAAVAGAILGLIDWDRSRRNGA